MNWHFLKNTNCVFINVHPRNMETFLCLFSFTCFNVFKHQLNWYFMKNLSCVFVSVFMKMHSRKRWTRFFVWIFLHFSMFLTTLELNRKPFDGCSGFAWINWYFMKNLSCVFVNIHSQNMEAFLYLNCFIF